MRRYLFLKEKFIVLLQILRLNLRTSMITLIGLSIALSTITTNIIYLETNKADYYLSLFKRGDFSSIVRYSHDPNNIQAFEQPKDLLSLQESLDEKISDHGLENLLVKHPFYPLCLLENKVFFLNQSDSSSFYGLNLNESILTDCVEGSYLPTNMNDTILLTPSLSGLNIGDNYDISIYLGPSIYYSHTLRIVGLITPESLGNNSLLNEVFPPYVFQRLSEEPIKILTTLGEFLSLFRNIESDLSSLTTIDELSISLHFRVDIQTTNLNPNNVLKEVPSLLSFLIETDIFYLDGYLISKVYNTNIPILISQLNEYKSFFFNLLLLGIPAFIAAILLVNFSLGLIYESRKKNVLLFKTRGVSSQFLIKALFLEGVVIAIIAVIISSILGLIGFFFFSTTTGYLTFDITQIRDKIVIPDFLLPVTISFSIIFTFLTSFRAMNRLAKSKLVLLDQEVTATTFLKLRKIPKAFNQVLLFLGLAGIIFLALILQLINESNLDIESPELFMLFSPLIIILIILSPISCLIGFILTYNQYLPLLMNKLRLYCWKKDWGLLALAIRNLSINHKITRQVTLLTACTLSFLMILSSFPISNYRYIVDRTYYDAGAEIKIYLKQADSSETILQEVATQLSSIQGLQFTIVSYLGFSYTDNNGIYHDVNFCGIEENFHQVAYWQDYYDDQSLKALVQALFNSTNPFPIILDSNTAQNTRITQNNVYHPFPTALSSIEFTVEEVSNCWPGFIDTKDNAFHFGIVQRTLLENISTIIDISNEGIGYSPLTTRFFCKVTTGYDSDVITAQLLNVTRNYENLISIKILRSQIENYDHHISTQILWIIINFNFFNCLCVVLLIIVLFAVVRIFSYNTEIGLSRALGMKYQQVFLLLFMEPVVLFLLSGIPGSCMGLLMLIFVTIALAPLLVPIPPFILDYNLSVILLVYLLIFSVTIIAGVATSFFATRIDISRLLKVE